MLRLREIAPLLLCLLSLEPHAADTHSVIDLQTRGVTQRFAYSRPAAPLANVVVLPGGDGVLQIQADGAMLSKNAACDPLIRNLPAMTRRGYASALVDTPSDQRYGLSESFWTSGERVGDVMEIIRYMRKQADVPVWVIGGNAASRSALAVAINYPSDGVLGTVVYANEDMAEMEANFVRGPTLVVNHANVHPQLGESLFGQLIAASVREEVVLSGGTKSSCGYEMFEGLDWQLVGAIGGFIDRNSAALGGGEPRVKAAVEYYNASLDHYFVTHDLPEIAILDEGVRISGWRRTGQSFNVLRVAQDGTSPVCRFYIPPALGNSHFYGRGAAECAATAQKNPSFVVEDAQFFHMLLPVQGACTAGTRPIYRVFDNRTDANHRYVAERSVREQMTAIGWIAEGDGPDLVVMCAPL